MNREKIMDDIELLQDKVDAMRFKGNNEHNLILREEIADYIELIFNEQQTVNKSGSALLTDLLKAQQEIISNPIRFNGVAIEDIKRIFADYGIKYEPPF